jgi:hypothetical protein
MYIFSFSSGHFFATFEYLTTNNTIIIISTNTIIIIIFGTIIKLLLQKHNIFITQVYFL